MSENQTPLFIDVDGNGHAPGVVIPAEAIAAAALAANASPAPVAVDGDILQMRKLIAELRENVAALTLDIAAHREWQRRVSAIFNDKI